MLKAFFNEFNDWATNNDLYMTYRHCLGGDKFTLNVIIFCTIGIVISYTLIGFRFLKSYLASQKTNDLKPYEFWKASIFAKNNLFLVAVFLGCAVSGYGFEVVKVFWTAYRLLAVTRVILQTFCVFSVYYTFKTPPETVELDKKKEEAISKNKIRKLELETLEYEKKINSIKSKYINESTNE